MKGDYWLHSLLVDVFSLLSISFLPLSIRSPAIGLECFFTEEDQILCYVLRIFSESARYYLIRLFLMGFEDLLGRFRCG